MYLYRSISLNCISKFKTIGNRADKCASDPSLQAGALAGLLCDSQKQKHNYNKGNEKSNTGNLYTSAKIWFHTVPIAKKKNESGRKTRKDSCLFLLGCNVSEFNNCLCQTSKSFKCSYSRRLQCWFYLRVYVIAFAFFTRVSFKHRRKLGMRWHMPVNHLMNSVKFDTKKKVKSCLQL